MFAYTKIMQALRGFVNDVYFNLVTLLLPGNGTNGAQNNTFLDSSSNNFSITRNGNVTQGTFSPFSVDAGEWSVGFLASNQTDYVPIPTATLTAFAGWGGRRNTLEAIVFYTPVSGNGQVIAGAYNAVSANGRWNFGISSSGKLRFSYTTSTSTETALNTTASVPTGQFVHVAIVVDSNTSTNTTIQMYINGVGETFTNQNLSTQTSTYTALARFGSFTYGAENGWFNGYISNLRWGNTSVYSANFTAPTEPLSPISGTFCLIFQDNFFKDRSTTNATLTPFGSAQISPFGPFLPTDVYSAATVGGSGYFDGTDSLTVAGGASLAFGSGDFSLEAFVYPTTSSGTRKIYDGRPNTTAGNYPVLHLDGNNAVFFVDVTALITGTLPVPANAWTHILVSRVSGNLRLFVNGVQDGSTVVNATNFANGAARPAIAVRGTTLSNDFYTGYISSVRVLIGSGFTSVTVPIAPLTPINNTSLLLNYTNAGITDASAKNVLETVGNASISTTQSKFGGSSMFFDGSGDYLSARPKIQSNSIQSNNATIEMWVYTSNSSSSLKCLVDTRSAQNTNTGFGIYQIANNVVIYGAGVKGNAAGQLTGNAWTHLAVTRANVTNYVFINGTLYNTFSYGNVLTSGNVTIGSDVVGSNAFTGYIDDLRITNGVARYTANFAPTTTAFPLQ